MRRFQMRYCAPTQPAPVRIDLTKLEVRGTIYNVGSGGGGGGTVSADGYVRTQVFSITTPGVAGGITTAALSETMLSGDVLEVVTGNTSGSVDGYADYIVDAILDLPYTSGTPSNTHGAIGRPIVRQNASGSNSGTDTNLYIWKNSDSTTDLDSIMIATGGDSSVAIVGFRIIFGGTTVAANPGGSGLTALSSMTIGDTDYSITGSGGGGASDWVDLGDTAASITASRIVHSNAAGDELVFGHVTTALINDMAVTGDKIEDNTIDSRHLIQDSVTSGKIENSAVTENKIVAGGVTTAKLDSEAVTTGKIAANAVTHAKVHADVVAANPGGSGLTALETVTIRGTDYEITGSGGGGGGSTDWISLTDTASSITADRVVHSNSAGDELVFGHVTSALLADAAVTHDKIGAAAVDTDNITADAITHAEIADDAVRSEHIQLNAVGASEIAGSAILSQHILDGQVMTIDINDAAVTTVKLGADSVTNAKIADNSVGQDQLIGSVLRANPTSTGTVALTKLEVFGTTYTVASGGGGGASDFTDLDDTPGSITADRVVLGNGAGDALIMAQIQSQHIGTGAVSSVKIATGGVAEGNLANNAVTNDKLADNAVHGSKIQNLAITTGKYANGSHC